MILRQEWTCCVQGQSIGRCGWKNLSQWGEVEDEAGDVIGLSMQSNAGRVEELDFILSAV